MGYLQLNCPAVNLTKAVVSIWFRIPQETAGIYVSDTFSFLPLITFGNQQTVTQVDVTIESTGTHVTPFCSNETYPLETGSYDAPVGPSAIGVQFFPSNSDPFRRMISVQLQTNIEPDLNVYFISASNPVCVGAGGGGDPAGWLFTYTDISQDFAFADSYLGIASISNPINVDKWHHLLLSWDLSNGSATHGSPYPYSTDPGADTVSKMWFALDDVNHNGDGLPAFWARDLGSVGPGPNDIVSTACTWPSNGPTTGETPTASLAGGGPIVTQFNIPGPPFSIFSGAVNRGELGSVLKGDEAANPVKKIEMGELQMYAGASLDTSILANRRLFVTSDGKPEKIGTADATLGRSPIISLSGKSNWKAGTNKGTLGDLTPVGTIDDFTPGPGLGS